RALELVEAKKIEDANRLIREWPDEGEHGIQILNGRYGPYITNKEKNARVPKDREPLSLTLEECVELLEKAPVRRGRKKKVTKKAAAARKKVAKKKKTKKKTTRKKAAKKKAATKKKATSKKTTKKKVAKKKISKKAGKKKVAKKTTKKTTRKKSGS
ncbi:MAG: DNA topoisomerase I, partial [Gammaproteobacteria bacterium]|nr:DNA topoisomerase I [Gammaproteobacteria bacterium]